MRTVSPPATDATRGAAVPADRARLGPTLGVAAPVRGRVALTSFLGAGAVLADVGLIGTAAWLVVAASSRPNEARLALAIVGVQFFGLARGFLRYGERLCGHDAALRLLASFRVRVFERLERLAPAGLPAFRHGDLLTRMVADVDAIQDLVVRVLPPFAVAVIVGATTVGFLWWLLPVAGLVVGAALLVGAVAVPWLTSALARRREARFAPARAELNAALVDLTDGAAELVAFGAIGDQVRTIGRLDAELTSVASASASTAGTGAALATLAAGLAGWACLVVGIPAALSGRLPGSDLAVVVLVPLATFELLAALPAAVHSLDRVQQSAARVFGVLEAPVPVSEPARPVRAGVGPHELVTSDLRARHPGAVHPAVVDVDLALVPGRRVALVGPSGSGKSTLAEVLVRFLAYERGTVRLDEVPLERLSGAEVRGIVGLVDQEAHLFDSTIAANLRIGRPSAIDSELHGALARVGLADWVGGLPDGLATGVGHQGTRVSGGQRRRLALARALLADFPVLVVDEPTEHLDPAAADGVLEDLLNLSLGGERSLLVITHRLVGLESVDEIVVLDQGRVVERGSHDALVAMGGLYADLWWAQTGGGSLTPVGEPLTPVGELRPPASERPRAAARAGARDRGNAAS